MALINVSRSCQECGKTRERLAELRQVVEQAVVRYEELATDMQRYLRKIGTWEKKMAERADANGTAPSDALADARRRLIERKLSR